MSYATYFFSRKEFVQQRTCGHKAGEFRVFPALPWFEQIAESAVISYLGAKYSESYPVKLIFGVIQSRPNRPLNF